jgi:hypothetical protein
MESYIKELKPDDQKYVFTYIDSKLKSAGQTEDVGRVVNSMSAEEIFNYYKSDLSSALKSNDKAKILQILDTIDSEDKKAALLDFMVYNKDELLNQ